MWKISKEQIKKYNRTALVKKRKMMLLDPLYALAIRKRDSAYRKLPQYQAKRRIANLKRLENPEMRLHNNVARLIRYSLGKAKGHYRTEGLLGYSAQTLKEHLEKQFDSKMNWANYGTYWHIDHILPRSWPKVTFERLWALDNLRPLEAKENILKGNSLEWQPNVYISCRK